MSPDALAVLAESDVRKEDVEGPPLDGHSNVIEHTVGENSVPQDADNGAMIIAPSTDIKLDMRFEEKEHRCVCGRCIPRMVNITHRH